MGDSEDEYDRKRRDKFRGERTESYSRDGRRGDDRRREEWMERESWGRSRGRQGGGDYSGGGGGGGGSSRGGDYMGGGRMGGGRGGDGGGSRYSPPNPHPSSHPRSNPHDHISPPLKRARVSEWEDRRYGGGHDTGYSSYGSAWSHEGSYGSHMGYGGGGGYGGQRGSDMAGMSGSMSGGGGVSEVAGGQTQPPMLSFKAYLATQDDNITDEEAIRKYNEYKMEFRRQQLNEFFVAHKEEEWFKIKYHPEDSIKRKDEQMGALKKRVTIFMEFLDSGRLGSVTVDADQSEGLVRLLDAVVIRLEGGTAIDLRALENPPENTTHQSHAQGSSSMLAITGSTEASGGRSGVQDVTPSSPNMVSERPSTPGAQPVEKKSEGPVVDKSEESSKPDEITMKQDNGIDSEKTLESQIPLPSKPKPKGRGKKRKRGYDFESGGSDEEDDDDKDEDDDDMDEDDDGGEEEPVPPGMEDEPPPPGLEGKEDEDDEEEKEEEDEYEDAKRKEAENGDKSEGREDGEEEDEEEEATKKETLVEEEPKKEEPKVSSDPDQQTPRPLHKTSSIFLRNLAPTITKQEVEAMCKRYPGFLRVAIADPQPERRWFRRGWVTFERSVNIKDICWNLNNIRLRDCELGAIVNRDLSRRIRTVNGVTSHRQVVRHDIKLAARIVHNLDAKCTLWQEEEEDNANGDNSSEKEEKKNKSKKNSGKHKSDSEIPSFGLVSRNPVLKNITDYLIEEASAEEEELLGLSSSNSAATGAAAGSSSSAAGDQEEGQLPADETSVSHPTVERDEALIKVLDRLLLYLRIVHSVDYYNHCEYPNEDEMPNRCGIMHARGSPPSSKVTQQEISDYCRTFEQKIASFLQPTVKLTEDEFVKLGAKDPDSEVEKFIISNTQELSKDKWLCPLSGKKFRGPEFVRKHIFNKHGEKVEEVKKEVEYFNNYLRDPKRPQLPEHPGNRPGRKEAMLGGGGPGDREPYSSQAYMPHYGYGYGGGGGRHFANSYGSGGYGGYGRDSYARGGVDGYARSNPRAYSRSRVVSQSDYSNRPLVAYNDLDMPDEKEFF